MAHWDKEIFATRIPDAVQCKNCKYALDSIKVGNYTQERYSYGECKEFNDNPIEILIGKAVCAKWESKDER